MVSKFKDVSDFEKNKTSVENFKKKLLNGGYNDDGNRFKKS